MFGSVAISVTAIGQFQPWMAHAHIKTTMRHVHHKSRATDARVLSAGFEPRLPEAT